jgi:hypothetical protein
VTHISPENAWYPLFTTFHDPVRCDASALLGTLAPNASIVRGAVPGTTPYRPTPPPQLAIPVDLV